jgi:tetraacyldisaccharide 4'-kinase
VTPSWWAQRGLLAQAMRPISWVYRLLTHIDRWQHRVGWQQIHRLPVPVLVIGNWITGGGGKTPTLLAVLEILRQDGLDIGVVSRGYGRLTKGLIIASEKATAADLGDEPMLIYRRTQTPLAVAEHRAEAAQALLAAHPELQLIVCDDGLQHHGLARDLSLLVFDRRGLGNGLLLPAGPLRQDRDHPPLPTSRREHLVLYTDGVNSTSMPGFLAARRLGLAKPLADWWLGKPSGVALSALTDRPWLACAGLAQPENFFESLRAEGLAITGLPLPDHARLDLLPWPAGARVLITEKDAVKLAAHQAGCEHVWVVPLDLLPEPAFAQALRAHVSHLLATPHGPAPD